MRRDVVVLACAISAGIHAALAPEHFREGLGAGVGFAAAALLLGAGAVAALRTQGGPLSLALAALFAGLIGSWALAVTTGLPVLQPTPEPVDGVALFTKAVELAGLAAAAGLAAERRAVRAVPVLLVALVGAYSGLAALAFSGGSHHRHGGAAHHEHR